MRRKIVLLFLVSMTVLAACRRSPGTTSSTATAAPASPAGRPQAKLPTLKLWLGAHEITAELATTPKQHETGMMFRTNMGTMEGMLFVFQWPEQRAFWMKNTIIPLDVAYIDTAGLIREIHPLQPLNENPAPSQSAEIQYVLEMNQGWFSNHNVAIGMEVRTEKGSLRDTFFRR